jgi:DNA-binding winged helix-turn-helix (wHTH) protein
MASFRIGDWVFSLEDNELRKGDERRRLEHRAARTLATLCSRRGEIVSRNTIVDEVWDGRMVSPNSVSIVISDLRTALGDDARQPLYIETIAKRGYRLLGAEEVNVPAAPEVSKHRRALISVGLVLMLALAIFIGVAGPARPPVTLLVGDVVNQTGNSAMDPLAHASAEVMMSAARRFTGAHHVVQATGDDAGPGQKKDMRLLLTGRLVMWSGKPTLMMSATNIATGEIVWNGQSRGGEDNIPADTAAAMRDLGEKLK